VLRRLATGGAALAAAVLLAGCGTGGLSTGRGDEDNGRKLFQGTCGGCHTLAAAGTQGTVGPNLDDSFAQARSEGFKESAIREIVHEQIKYPGQFDTGNEPDELQSNMPPNLVRGQNAEDVAAYVAANAGKNGFAEAQQLASTNGKTIFRAKCGGCHTLADAGTKGTQGPNLDALKPPFDVARHQVEVGGGIMPAFKGTLTDAQITAVARYVSSVAGKGK
jgi:cbb3-type cytochrome c oxidase subunit III